MALFRSSMDAPWSTNRWVSFILYSIFLGTSVWATGESLARSLEFEGLKKLFCYVLGFAMLATASFCLRLLKKSMAWGASDGRNGMFWWGLIGFVILWFAILTSNTHNIYYVMTTKEQRRGELAEAKTQLELMKEKSVAEFQATKTKFSNAIEIKIGNLKSEIQNSFNRGHGPKTDTILNQIEQELGANIEKNTNPPTDRIGLRTYADIMAEKIRRARDTKLELVDSKINQLSIFLNKDEFSRVEGKLQDLIENFDNKSESETDQGLRNAYSTYRKGYEYVETLLSEPFITKYKNENFILKKLSDVPNSIECQDISYCWNEFVFGKNIDKSRFRWAIFIAIILDLACFLFFYFGVLPEDEN